MCQVGGHQAGSSKEAASKRQTASDKRDRSDKAEDEGEVKDQDKTKGVKAVAVVCVVCWHGFTQKQRETESVPPRDSPRETESVSPSGLGTRHRKAARR